MEGAFRPGHFNGVATVVEALFKKLAPNRAYFGEKDYQQLQIVKALNKQLDLKIKIVSCPIIREKDGLAMSSRNTLLSPAQREAAPVIFKSLKEIKSNQIQWSVSEMEAFFQASIERESQLKLDYFYVAKTSDLIPTHTLEAGMTYRIFVAVFAGKTRLIDTVELEKKNTFTPC
jgi:pantoate--beta-alanine ligase